MHKKTGIKRESGMGWLRMVACWLLGGHDGNGARTGQFAGFTGRIDLGVAPTARGGVDIDFDGSYDVSMDSALLFGQWFGSGTAYGSASIQTVYERFDLVSVPEPGVFLMLMAGAGLLLQRRRA